MIEPITTTATAISQLRPMSSRRAMNTPPTIMIGAWTIMNAVIITSVCTCWTSLVVRVMRVGAPKLLTSRVLNDRPDVSPAVLRERVTSKGGTTYAALTHLESKGVKDSFVAAMRAAQQRAAELGDEFGR